MRYLRHLKKVKARRVDRASYRESGWLQDVAGHHRLISAARNIGSATAVRNIRGKAVVEWDQTFGNYRIGLRENVSSRSSSSAAYMERRNRRRALCRNSRPRQSMISCGPEPPASYLFSAGLDTHIRCLALQKSCLPTSKTGLLC